MAKGDSQASARIGRGTWPQYVSLGVSAVALVWTAATRLGDSNAEAMAAVKDVQTECNAIRERVTVNEKVIDLHDAARRADAVRVSSALAVINDELRRLVRAGRL